MNIGCRLHPIKILKQRPRLITEAKGVYLKNHEGNTQIDASSGLFCNPLGHGRQRNYRCNILNQLKTLDYAQPFQQGFGGSFRISNKNCKTYTRKFKQNVFIQFVDQLQLKQQSKSQLLIIKQEVNGHRFRFVGRERAYHGMNIGCYFSWWND